jgi:sodium transport system ATP-binding protein
MLKILNLSKQFDQKDQKTKTSRKVGIKDISFDVTPGRVLGLVGPNGAGKTTTMRIISALTKPHSGDVLLDGKSTLGDRFYKSKVSLISSETQPYERLTAREQLNMAYQLADLPKNEQDRVVDELATELEMTDFIDKPNQSFSSGMKQKINIARGLVTNPDILVFDEVTNGLDIFAARAVKERIRALREKGKYIVFSTHIMTDAQELCDDLVIVYQGKVLEHGDKLELLAKYKVDTVEELFFTIIKEQN